MKIKSFKLSEQYYLDVELMITKPTQFEWVNSELK